MKTFALPLAIISIVLTGCMVQPRNIGRTPELSPVSSDAMYPALTKEQSALRYPDAPRKYSTWNNSGGSLFTSRRTMRVGDVLTVDIVINDRATFDNKSDRQRTSNKSIGLSGQTSGGVSGSADGSFNSGTTFAGAGATQRSEQLNLSVAAVVTAIAPTGNLLIRGTQEVLVNAEKRIVTVTGLVRPMDIGPDNTVPYEKIAEARVSYGGTGRITEVQQPPYGQQALDMLLPI